MLSNGTTSGGTRPMKPDPQPRQKGANGRLCVGDQITTTSAQTRPHAGRPLKSHLTTTKEGSQARRGSGVVHHRKLALNEVCRPTGVRKQKLI